MISFRRLLYILLVVILVSGIFMIYNFNEERDTQIQTVQKEIEEIHWIENADFSESDNMLRVVLCGKREDEPFDAIYENVLTTLQRLRIPYTECGFWHSYMSEPGDVVVFCSDLIGDYAELMDLGGYISNGGRVILAAGLPEGNQDSYLSPYLGIVEKSIPENYDELQFTKAIWPFQPEKITFDGYNLSTWIQVRKDAEIYAQDQEKGVPLVYTYQYDQGKTCVINGSFLSQASSAGLVTGALSAVCDDFIYPIVGTKSVFLDNFPMVTYVNDALCTKMYGCVTESFVRDIVWPFFQGMGLRTNTVYSSGVLVENQAPARFPEIHDSLFVTIGKSALQFDGEFIYAGYASEDGEYDYNRKFMDKFKTTFPNYEIRGLAVMSDVFDPGMLHVPDTNFSVVRTDLQNPDVFCDQDGYYLFPQLSKGNQVDGPTLWPIASLHAAFGMLSHTFDVNTLIAEDEETASWDRDKLQIDKFEEDILAHITYLKPCTLSQTENFVKSYHDLQYSWNRQGDTVTVQVDRAMEGQPFFFHTTKSAAAVQGAELVEIENGYYLLRMQQKEATITFES